MHAKHYCQLFKHKQIDITQSDNYFHSPCTVDRIVIETDKQFQRRWLSYLYKLVKCCLSVCVCVSGCGTSCSRCTQRLVIL